MVCGLVCAVVRSAVGPVVVGGGVGSSVEKSVRLFPASVHEWDLDCVTSSVYYLVVDKSVSPLVNDSVKDWAVFALVLEWLRE